MVGRYRKNFGAATMFRCDRAQMNSAFRRLLKAILAPERTAAIKAKAAQPQVSTCATSMAVAEHLRAFDDWGVQTTSNSDCGGRCSFGAFAARFHSCSGGDLNPHVFRHTPLKRTCLPFHHPSDGAFAWAKIAANPNLPQPEFSKSLV